MAWKRFFGDIWSSAKSTFVGNVKSTSNIIRHPINTATAIYDRAKAMSDGELGKAYVKTVFGLSPVIHNIKAEVGAVKAIVNRDGKAFGKIIGGEAFNATVVLTTEAAGKAIGALKGATSKTITLYRGGNESHPGFSNAVDGAAAPLGGTATAAEHNAGNTASPYTSWTTDPEVATNYALRPNGSGVVMEIQVPVRSTTASPSLKDVYLKQSPGVKVNEAEVLMKGTVSGAKVNKVN